jgi:exosome complex component CSL4
MAKESSTVPGDKVASIEEFEGADGTYQSDGVIRASRIGKTIFDLKGRTVKVSGSKASIFLKPNDIVLGIVDMMTGSMVSMKILYINDERSDAGFGGLHIMRFGRGRRVTICRTGDLVRARVVSIMNANIHVAFDRTDLGVLSTVCNICGGNVTKISRGVKCVECGAPDERKFADDYGKDDLLPRDKRGQS